MKTAAFDQRVEHVCRRAGLAIRNATLRDGLLRLTPKDLEVLPDAERLRKLAEELTSGDVRWVTLVLEDDDD